MPCLPGSHCCFSWELSLMGWPWKSWSSVRGGWFHAALTYSSVKYSYFAIYYRSGLWLLLQLMRQVLLYTLTRYAYIGLIDSNTCTWCICVSTTAFCCSSAAKMEAASIWLFLQVSARHIYCSMKILKRVWFCSWLLMSLLCSLLICSFLSLQSVHFHVLISIVGSTVLW